MDWSKLADEQTLQKTANALQAKGVKVYITKDKKQAFEKVMDIIPNGAEVMDLTSVTLDETGISKETQESGKYLSVRKKIMSVSQKEMRHAMRKMSASVDYAVGSVHAVTEDGKFVIASNSGSQLGAYAFGAGKLIWVIGTQKIVKDMDDAMKRIYQYSLPLEDARARKAYGVPSAINKILILEKETVPDRITVVFVKENLGF